ncbi:MAG: DNA translocase FtsK 4TM domain-containing protein [Alphaproteobacteria bacterium]|nr:DNA translocase FtsK 4TM domain-containing protein [Alphaproteobacteria bacterium]
MAKKTNKKSTQYQNNMLTKLTSSLLGVFLLVFSVSLILSMFGYTPTDESFNVSNSDSINNFMGRFGSYSADLIVNSFGMAIFVFLIPLFIWGYLLISHHKILEFKIRLLAVILGTITLSGTLYTVCPNILEVINLQGKFSHVLPEFLSSTLKSWGANEYSEVLSLAILVIISIMSFNLATGITFKHWFNISKAIAQVLHRILKSVCIFLQKLIHPSALYNKKEETISDINKKEPILESNNEVIVEEKTITPKTVMKKTKEAKAPIVSPKVKTNPQIGYNYPSINLLSRPKDKIGLSVNEKELNETARTLEVVLEEYGIQGKIVKVRPGPVVTLYELNPAAGIKTSRIISLADDIARSMAVSSVRIATVTGSTTVGIEVPNNKRETVWVRDLLEDVNFTDSKNTLNIVLGKDIGGKNVYADLAKMPHLLIAGTTGSGKSVGVNAMILSLLYRMTPDECKFMLIDPKMLEFSMYNGIPHLLTPVITDPSKAVIGLKWAVREMEERYRAMACLSVRNITGYNLKLKEMAEKGEKPSRTIQVGFDENGKPKYEEQLLDTKPLPYIVIVVDEAADLMMVAGKEVEAAIQRLAQMARAAGIHLIMSTQRPSADVITGTIKSNFPTRISYQVTSKINSRTILDEQGAEQLLGRGDMLYMPAGLRPQRVHGGFVPDQEVEAVMNFLKSQGEPQYVEGVTEGELETKNKDSGSVFDKTSFGGGSKDDLFEEAVNIVRQDKRPTISYLQRRLGIGYNKAASLIERMEEEGIVTKADANNKREVI